MGPVVNGRPTNKPLTAGPQRRPANVTEPIKDGVINSLKANIVMSYKLCGLSVCIHTAPLRQWIVRLDLDFPLKRVLTGVDKTQFIGRSLVSIPSYAGGEGK